MPLASILIVDDDALVRQALRRDLERLDFALHLADSPASAFETLRRERIDVVISDHAMPGMTGLRFLRFVRDRYPQIVRIMLTGAASLQTAVEAINEDEIYRFLEKPWDREELKFMLLQACDRIRKGTISP
jgi:two-component system, probable response regulator PhcQ